MQFGRFPVQDSYIDLIKETLSPHVGDIIITECPYEDASRDDFFPFSDLDEYEAGHTSLWVDSDRPIAHATREGYRLPGVRLTHLFDGRHTMLRPRHPEDKAAFELAGNILKTWALSTRTIGLADYHQIYPEKNWLDRHASDVRNFFTSSLARIAAPSIPYNDERADVDKFALARDASLQNFAAEGLRRAIKFATRRELTSPNPVSKGQRCTAVVIAAIQAAYLAPIVLPLPVKQSFKAYKKLDPKAYIHQYLIPDWEKTPIGSRLKIALETGNYAQIFPEAILVDQRYALPTTFLKALQADESHFETIGYISKFQDEIALYNTEFEEMTPGALTLR